ncbi:MAG: 50S ribosomal protein L10 [Candidatus Aenigmarchaeota archaeon]|nr:50S ribosomal protein L10 [Candidatus Aenigmarchaeota archaeon]
MKAKERKEKLVEELRKMLDEYPIVGIVNLYKMPSAQLQSIRKMLSKEAKIKMTKKTLMTFALEKSKRNKIKELEKYLKGQPAFIFTKTNPFKLFKFLDENKTSAPAKIGDIAPNDIVIKKGNTGLPPGPAIGQLGSIGIPTKVEGGKIHVVKDTVVAAEGDIITPEISGVLNALNISPMKIGLDLTAVYEEGVIYDKSVLKIDEEEIMKKLQLCIRCGIELSLESSYITKSTATLAIRRSYLRARTLAKEAGIYSKDVIADLLMKAYNEGSALKNI